MKSFKLLYLTFLVSNFSFGQVLYPGDYTEEYYRTVLLKNPIVSPKPLMIRPSIIEAYSSDSTLKWNIWEENFTVNFKKDSPNSFNILNPRISYVFNQDYPRGYNDGPIWSGKGSNMSFTAGVSGNFGILHFTFAPIFWLAQNQEYHIPSIGLNKNPLSYPVEQKIDWVMRYGEDSYHEFDWGQSEIRLIYKNFTLGFSTANFSWGPARYNPIIMSKNAPGFPHFDLGTATPMRTKIGDIEFKWYWGALYESEYFDDKSINDRKYITGFTMGYQPSFIKGFTVGLTRIMYTRWAEGDLSAKDFFNAFIRNTHKGLQKNDEYDQMFSAIVEYEFPEVGAHIYVEYSRNDFYGSILDFAEHPDRTRGVTIGFTKTYELKNGNLLEFNIENTTISSNQLQILLPGLSATYYVHGVVPNGYTHKGQVVGAGIGPGSNTGNLTVNIYNPKGKLGFLFQRIRFNDDYAVNAFAGMEDDPTDYEISIGADWVRMFNKFSINPRLLWHYRNNLLFEDNDHRNISLNLSVQYFINK